MPLVAIVMFFLIMMSKPAHDQASRILHGQEQNLMEENQVLGSPQDQVPPHILVPPSAPNPGTYIPNSKMTQRKNPPPNPSTLNKPYYVPPPTPGTYSKNPHPSFNNVSNTAPLTGSLQKCPAPPSIPNGSTSVP